MRIQVKKKKHWYYRIVAVNGRILLTSETYASERNATRAADKFYGDCMDRDLRKDY